MAIEYNKTQDGLLEVKETQVTTETFDQATIQAEITRLQGRKQAQIDERDTEIAGVTTKHQVFIDDFQAQIADQQALLVKAQELAVIADANVLEEEIIP